MTIHRTKEMIVPPGNTFVPVFPLALYRAEQQKIADSPPGPLFEFAPSPNPEGDEDPEIEANAKLPKPNKIREDPGTEGQRADAR